MKIGLFLLSVAAFFCLEQALQPTFTADAASLSEAYDVYIQKYLLKVPLPTVEGIKAVLEEFVGRNPKAKEADPKKFFADTFVRQLQSSGFIDALYRQTSAQRSRPPLNHPNKACYKRSIESGRAFHAGHRCRRPR